MAATKLIQGLRELADFLEANPKPEDVRGTSLDWTLFVNNKEQLAEAARWLGKCTKRAYGDWFCVQRTFGAVEVSVNITRPSVCERVKTGEKIIPAKPERTLPAEPEKIEEIYEWVCPESILA